MVNAVFPAGFVWGASTSAYQIEGAFDVDGKGPSVWDAFCRRPRVVFNGDSGEAACDHYHRYPEDVALMRTIGLQAYRFSISWPRVLPDGVGAVNPAGLDFYDRLVDALLQNHIQPYVTLFHWDYPLALYQRGAWLNRDSADWFADYAAIVARKLGDRVQRWMTWNEPSIFAMYAHGEGQHAPGHRLGRADLLRMAHHILLAHGKGVQALRAISSRFEVGVACTGPIGIPSRPDDIEAARRFTFADPEPNLWKHHWWGDPVILGQYPPEAAAAAADMPAGFEDDLATIHQPIDFYGLNVYSGDYINADANSAPQLAPRSPGHALTLCHWPVTPEVLYWATRFLAERYHLPILVTENGMSNCDWVHDDGQVHDPQRIDFTRRYLRQLARAIHDGLDVRGYFHWSLLDNFEWADGMKHRFGLIHVDYQTQKRTLKDSAHWYRQVIESNGAVLWTQQPTENTR